MKQLDLAELSLGKLCSSGELYSWTHVVCLL